MTPEQLQDLQADCVELRDHGCDPGGFAPRCLELLAAYDAQTTQLATAEQARDDALERIATLEAVMKSDATMNRIQADSAQLRRVNLDLVQRVHRLAALAQAARDYLDRNKFHDAAIEAAVAALDAAPAADESGQLA
jgi:hypothetical protein